MPSALVTLISLLIGLAIGVALGLLIAVSRKNSQSDLHSELTKAQAERDLYKKDLEVLQSKEVIDTKTAAEITAMKESVQALQRQANEANRVRTEAETRIDTTINEMRRANQSIFDETKKIAGALSNTQTRGKFGEAQLELLLTGAGLEKGREYEAQRSTTDEDNSGIPDITVKVPGGSHIFIDSKFPFDRFIEAFETDDQVLRDEKLSQHTDDLMKHVKALAKRGYHKSQKSPDFVILFLPFETLLSEALRLNPKFLDEAFKLNVTIATPTSMMALLRTVGNIYTRNQLAQSADEIQKVAHAFLKNLTLLHTKFIAFGKSVNSLSKSYDDIRPTLEKSVINPARKILSLGVSGDRDKLSLEYPVALGSNSDYIDVELIESEQEEENDNV